MLDGDALGLTTLGFKPCDYVELYCRIHGVIRLAVEKFEEGSDSWPCPLCNLPRAAGFLAIGLTRRDLPFFETLFSPVKHWPLSRDEEVKRPQQPAVRPKRPWHGGRPRRTVFASAEEQTRYLRRREYARAYRELIAARAQRRALRERFAGNGSRH